MLFIKSFLESQKFIGKFARAFFVVLILTAFSSCSDYFHDLKDNVDDIEVSYYVEHWIQNLDGKTYTQDDSALQKLTGMSHAKTNAKGKVYEGFSSKKIQQAVIDRDGSTVVKIYYDRNKIKYTFKATGGSFTDNKKDIVFTGLYGTDFVAPEDPSKTGYTFNSWDKTIPMVYGSTDLIFNAIWDAGLDTPYTVHFYKQNILDDEYTIDNSITQSKTGTTDSLTSVVPPTLTGFTINPVEQQYIKPDGSTIVNLYYKRNIIKVTFNPNGGKWSDNTTSNIVIEGKYGSNYAIPSNPTKTGYTFSAWNQTVPVTLPSRNTTYTSKWNANKYNIIYNSNYDGATVTQTFTYNVSQKIKDNPFKRNTWGFVKWNTAPNGNGTIYDEGQSVTNLSAVNNDTITLYALWGYPEYASNYDKKLGYICDTISLNYTIKLSLSNGKYSKTWNLKSGDPVPDIDVPSNKMTKGTTLTISVTAVNTEYNLTYKGSMSSTNDDNFYYWWYPTPKRQ